MSSAEISPRSAVSTQRPTPSRVLVVLDHASIGGGTTVAAALAAEWLERGVPVRIVAFQMTGGDITSLFPQGTLTVLDAAGHLTKLRAMRAVLSGSARDAAVLAIGEYPALIAVLARLTLLGRRQRIVIGEHQPHSIAEILGGRRGPVGRLAPAAVRWLRRRAAASICLSEQHREALVAAGLTTAARSVVTPNPCVHPVAPDDVVAARVRRLSAGGPVRLLAVGALNAAKDHPMLLRALARTDDRCSLTIVGGGEGGEREHLETLAHELGLDGRVELLGPRHDVAGIMDRHDVFVLSSGYESFGLVIVEAVVRGLPVVSTRCNTTIPALADRYGTLRLTPTGDDAALADAIGAAVEHDWETAGLLEAARLAAHDHDTTRVAERYLEVLTGS